MGEMKMATVIQVEVVVQAGKEVVWDAFTNPTHIVNWCFASDDWHCPAAQSDLRIGGTFVTTMAAKDGSMSFDFTGTFETVEPQARYSYVIVDGRKVEVIFEAADQGTKVIEKFEAESVNAEDLQKAGWQAILENFKTYTESLEA
jgi:uncharacterized protein YndB with AHSA1/START domain